MQRADFRAHCTNRAHNTHLFLKNNCTHSIDGKSLRVSILRYAIWSYFNPHFSFFLRRDDKIRIQVTDTKRCSTYRIKIQSAYKGYTPFSLVNALFVSITIQHHTSNRRPTLIGEGLAEKFTYR